MNILYLHTHDSGRYIQPYGMGVSTPNLMKLAQEGTLFRKAFCAAPTCSPSRAGLLTGMAPHSCGMLGLAHRHFKLNDYSQHLASYLGRFGYETVLCGVQHEAPSDEMIGYEKVISSKKKCSFTEQDETNASIAAEYLMSDQSKPFFLSFGTINTHRDFPEIDPAINPDYVMPPLTMYDTKENREDMAAYMSSALVADRCFGKVLDALERSGKANDTLVIFTTDHGIAFPQMKCTLYDTGIGVSLILKYPGNPKAGQTVDALISQLDLYPTICGLIGIESPSWLQGTSLLPLLNGEKDSVRGEVFSEVNFHAAYEPMRCIRTERYKLIRYYDSFGKYVAVNMDDSTSKSFVIDQGFLQQKMDSEMLFDLYLDPLERVNQIDNPCYREILEQLSEKLLNWQKSTDDPILAGDVPMPEGAVIHKRTCLSNSEQDFE